MNHFVYCDCKDFNDISFCMNQENKLSGCLKHYKNI